MTVDPATLRALIAKATRGPWYSHSNAFESVIRVGPGYKIADGIHGAGPEERHANAALIVAAVNSLPALLDELDALRADKDGAYLERNQVVAALAATVIANGGVAGIARTAIEGWSSDWHGCVYIELPTGQASWHYHDSQAELFAFLPAYHGSWDGHTTPEKYARLRALNAARQEGQ